jgi:hypothetical protein
MLSHRQHAIVGAAAALVGIWAVAVAGYFMARHSRMTAEKVAAYAASVDLRQLSGAARANAIQDLADRINALPFEERQRLRAGRMAEAWFNEMTDEEKARFIEATLPTGFKQMINAFEQMPEEKRRKAIDDALRRLREANGQAGGPRFVGRNATNRPPLSPELEAQVRTIGLKTFYSQSSAQTKAELAPLLEELQRAMESGRMRWGR